MCEHEQRYTHKEPIYMYKDPLVHILYVHNKGLYIMWLYEL